MVRSLFLLVCYLPAYEPWRIFLNTFNLAMREKCIIFAHRMDQILIDNSQTSPMQRLTLRKSGRLHHRTLVNALYDEGNTIYAYPLRLQWRRVSQEQLEASFRDRVPDGIDSVQMMVTVPKRRQRRAVDRVLMRRRIREAYRLNRHPLLNAAQTTGDATLSLAFVYIADKKCRYAKVERAMRTLLDRLAAAIVPTPPEE